MPRIIPPPAAEPGSSLAESRGPTSIKIWDDEVLCYGSDDEDYDSPCERYRRCQEAEARFLDGATLFLISANLKGPFEQSSGWTNPWRSKQRTLSRNLPRSRKREPSQLPDLVSSAPKKIKHSGLPHSIARRPQPSPPGAATPCHLPSPQSLDHNENDQLVTPLQILMPSEWFSESMPSSPCPRNIRFSSIAVSSGSRSILVSPRSARRLRTISPRRVSFQIHTNVATESDVEDTLDDDLIFGPRRQTSPPPEILQPQLGCSKLGKFHGHFAVASRKPVPKPSHQLLPTASQQVRESPGTDAMARTFTTADNQRGCTNATLIPNLDRSPPFPLPRVFFSPLKTTVGRELTEKSNPLTQDCLLSEEPDPVEEVMNNLDEYLDAWDLDADLARARMRGSPEISQPPKIWSVPVCPT